jgi:hypothetical protein
MVNWSVWDKFPLGTRLEGCMPISAWLDKGRIPSEFDRNEKNIIHLSKKNAQNALPFILLLLHLHL